MAPPWEYRMLAKTELSADFYVLNQQYKQLVAALLEIIDLPRVKQELDAEEGNPAEKIIQVAFLTCELKFDLALRRAE